MQQEASKESSKKGEDDEVTKTDEKKNDKPVPEKKQDSMEVDVDAVEPEDSKKKKKKSAKEETKEKGNLIYHLIRYLYG